MKINEHIGFLKSKIIYDYKPFNSFRLRRFYRQFVKEGNLCFDIGAHTGNRSNTWLNLKSRVVAVEPSSLFANHLRRRFKSNPDCIIEQKAISDTRGEKVLKISSIYPTVSTLSVNWSDIVNTVLKKDVYDKSEVVEVVTLQDLVEKYGQPDFCKIDIEGFENEALKGLKTPINALSFEFYSGSLDKTFPCIDLLEKLGAYKFNWSVAESLILKEAQWISGSRLKEILVKTQINNSGDIYAVITNIK